MPNQAKIQQVEDLVQKLSQAKSAALVQYQGLNAGQIEKLRDAIRTSGGVMEVVKNTILARVFDKAGTTLPEELTGPTAIAFSNQDEIAPLKEFQKMAKEKDKLSFKYGFFEGKLLSSAELQALLSLPSRTALLAQLIANLQNPLQRFVVAGKYQQSQLALTLKALVDKKSTTA